MSRYLLFSQPEPVAKNATLGHSARNRTRDFARSILVNLIRWNKATLMEGEGRRNEWYSIFRVLYGYYSGE